MCNAQTEDKRQRRIKAKNLNTHEESGGFHVVEVNSPINMSSSTMMLIVIVIAIGLYFYCKKYRRESRKERFRDAGGDPSNKAAFNAWTGQGLSTPADMAMAMAMQRICPPLQQQPVPALYPPAPLPQDYARPSVRFDHRPALGYSPYQEDRSTDYAVPSHYARARPTRVPPPTVAPPPPPSQAHTQAAPAPPSVRHRAATPPLRDNESVPSSPKYDIADSVVRRMDWDKIKPADEDE